ncbi:MAG TPA: peptidylprolyl isomerase [Verrucomicrobiae bacterium]|nr:peptidylprolyl isomerase [Verrucomicrobiae bacterium]
MTRPLAASAACAFLLASIPAAADQSSPDIGALARVEPTILVPRLTYDLGEGIVLQLTLTNPSNVPVTVPEACLEGSAVSIAAVGEPKSLRYAGILGDGKALTIPPRSDRRLDLEVSRRAKLRKMGRFRIAWTCGEWETRHEEFFVSPPYDKERDRVAVVTTDLGTLELVLMPDQAPVHVRNFVDLARGGFYDGLPFFRVIPGIEADTGDPAGTGNGGWRIQLAPEIDESIRPGRGLVGASRRETTLTSGSMFFILLDVQPSYKGLHTFFAYVRAGQEVLDALSAVAVDGADGTATFRPRKAISIRHIEIKGP